MATYKHLDDLPEWALIQSQGAAHLYTEFRSAHDIYQEFECLICHFKWLNWYMRVDFGTTHPIPRLYDRYSRCPKCGKGHPFTSPVGIEYFYERRGFD